MILVLFALLILYPVLRLLLTPLFPFLGPEVGEQIAGPLLQFPWIAVFNTVRLGAAAALLALPAGLFFGWLAERRRWTGLPLLSALLWLLFLMPSALLTTGWQIVFALPGLHHGAAARLFFGPAGIVLLFLLKGLPFACFAARASWRAIGAEIGDAARIHIPRRRTRQALLLPLLLPAAGAAFTVVFIENIQEFGIPATLGAAIHLPMLTYDIYRRLAATPVDFSHAASLSWALVLLAGAASLVHLYLAGRYGAALVHGRSRTSLPPPCSGIERVGAWSGMIAVGLTGVAVPVLALAGAALGPVADGPLPWDSLLHSGIYAAVAASLAVAVAIPVAKRRTLGVIAQANMAIPGLVLGAAYIIAFNSPVLPLYGTPALLVVAYVAAQVPMLIRFLAAPLGQLHPNLTDAARLAGLSRLTRLLDIEAPLLLPPFLWGWRFAFGHLFFELPISELLSPAGKAPLGVALVTLNQSLRYGEEARLALGGIAAAILISWGFAALSRAAFLPAAPEEKAPEEKAPEEAAS